jgi:hypothetical protein
MSDARVATSGHGVLLVLLSALTIAAWTAHLFAMTALARLNQLHPGVIWWMQAVTVVTAVPCLVVLAVAWSSVKRADAPEGEGSPMGRSVFLAWMTIVVAGFNLVLILLEGAYVSLLSRHA